MCQEILSLIFQVCQVLMMWPMGGHGRPSIMIGTVGLTLP
jgi:hypothetical protein